MRFPVRGLIAALSLAALPVASNAAVFVGVSVGIAPPALPVYVQPPCPAPGYIWIPGYWAWDDEEYYWVPGTWELAPAVGFLWTPGYWGWGDGFYLWHAGYWGPHVGFYGGINYGFGYFGRGFEGGYWRGNEFYYNRSVTNVNVTNITNVYNHTVVNEPGVSRVSFHGGAGGVAVRPTAAEMAVEHERHIGVTAMQRQHEQMARSDSSLRASVNGGRPAIAATPRPAVFSGHGVIAARGASPAGQRTDRPRQTQRPALAERSGGPRTDRPPQALRPADPRPPVHQAARPTMNPQYRDQGQYRGNAAAPGGGGPAMHAGGGRAPQAAPPPGAQHPQAQHPQAQHPQAQHPGAQHTAAEREQRERGH